MNALGKLVMNAPRGGLWHNVVTVDPGLGGTGAAFWHELGSAERHGVFAPDDTLRIVEPSGNWHDRLRRITDRLSTWLVSNRTGTMVLEMPRLWLKSAKSQSAVASGKLPKLWALCGAFILAARRSDIQVAEVYSDEWKGQLDDSNVHARIYKKLGLKFPTHVHDAVGMGLAIQGVLYERRG